MKINPETLDRKKAHDLLTDIITPRPIAFVSTIGSDGIYNAAPYSYFCPMSNLPMIVGFAVGRKKNGQKKDTLVNIEGVKAYVINVVTEALSAPMNKTAGAYPADIDEFEKAQLTPVAADIVKAPMIAESPINMECRLLQILEFGQAALGSSFVIGEVVRIHIKEAFLTTGQPASAKLKIIGRLGGGGSAYCRTTDVLRIKRH